MASVKSAAEIVAEMISSMAVADPELDTSVGSVARKIFDVVGEQVAPAYAVGYLQEWIYSIETKSGPALDDYVSQFGIYRIAAKRATGLVTFSRPTAARANTPIPLNTYVITGTVPRIAFATVSSATIMRGSRSVTVPVQAVTAGASGNLPVGSIIRLASPVSGVSAAVVQADATTGGVDAESDEALRSRFRRTVFRNLAGTEDMFLGVALEDSTPDDDSDGQAVHAVVIGPTRRWREQVQVQPDGTAKPTMSLHAKHVYADSSVFGPDIDSGSILTEGIHYTFTVGDPIPVPTVATVGDSLEVGTVYDLDYEYVSTASRNDPLAGITNRIDCWVSGVQPEVASETTYYRPQTFDNTAGSAYNRSNYVRLDPGTDSVYPATGNHFLQLAWGPIIEFPEILVINGVTYTRNVDFWVVHEDTAFGYTSTSRFGLEFAAAKTPPANAQIVLSGGSSYFYNRLPRDVEERANRWKLVTTDFKAHAAKQVRMILNFALMYSSSYERGAVQAGVDNAIATWMNSVGFKTVVQISDLIQIAHNVPGVDNIRFLGEHEPALADDPDSWGVQWVREDGTHNSHMAFWPSGAGSGRATDWYLFDNQIPVLYDVRYVTKAQNTFGTA